MILARLALRSILRQRRRTLLTSMVLAAGFVALSLAGGFMAQTFQGLADSAIRGGLGHIQILPVGSGEGSEEQSLEHALPDYETLAARLKQDPGVVEVLPRMQFMGLLSGGSRSVAFLGTAVDPGREARFMSVLEGIQEGAHASGGAGSRWLTQDGEAVLGTGLARSLGLSVGDSATLLATTRDGALNGVDVTVVGLQDQGVKELNDRSLVVSLGTGERLLDAGKACSRLSLWLKRPAEARDLCNRLRQKLGVEARPWSEQASFYRQVKLLYGALFGFMGLVLALVVLLATANTLLMSVLERVREFGTLRAMGLQPYRLVALLQWEGAWLGILGNLSGLVFTLLLRAALNALHLQMPAPPGSSHGYPLYIHWVPGVYLGVALGLQGVIQLSAWLPGWKAARLRITEALRYV